MGRARCDRAGQEVVGRAAGHTHRRRTFLALFPPIHPANKHGTLQLTKATNQGTSDNFYKQGQLLPENLVAAAKGKGKVNVRWQDGYDHSYFTMATFADDHVGHAARYLLA